MSETPRHSRHPSPEAWIVTDLGFGDAGKGSITDFLVRERRAGLVVRANGGGQAGHNVVTPGGRHHTFAQFGSGSFVPGVRTLLGPAFVLHPGGMWIEAERLAAVGVADVLARTTINRRALVTSPFQQAAGRLRELLRGKGRHGTCGIGFGETVADALAGHDDTLRASDLEDAIILRRRLARQQERKRTELAAAGQLRGDSCAAGELDLLNDPGAVARVVAMWSAVVQRLRLGDEDHTEQLLRRHRCVVFEGAQGVLLDQTWGFHPHTTWSDCTSGGAMRLLEGQDRRVVRLGLVRCYATRHGEGPFPTHDPGHGVSQCEPHQDVKGWQGQFRTGPLDLVLLRYALEVNGGVDGLAVTCLDQIAERDGVALCDRYLCEDARRGLVVSDGLGAVERLVPGDPADLDHRERLGELLGEVRPVCDRMAPADLVGWIEERLGMPVLIQSMGPTAREKRWRGEPGGLIGQGAGSEGVG